MATLKQLADRLDAYAAGLPKRSSDLAAKAADTILTDLVHVTPVDTSEAVSNWQIGLDTKPTAKLEPYFSGKKGSTGAQSAAAALEAGRNILHVKKPGQTIYISNVLPYIRLLNDGSSKQAPAGFIERAVLLGRRFMGTHK